MVSGAGEFLYGYCKDGDYGVMVENKAEQIAAFIMKHNYKDSTLTNLLDMTEIEVSFGFIQYCRDQDFLRTELIPTLAPMQTGQVKPPEFVPFEPKEEVKPGIWTPKAKVICYECHGPTFKNRDFDPETRTFSDKTLSQEEWEKVISETEVKEGYIVTLCDDCGEEIQVDESVAAEHNLVLRLKEAGIDAAMAQTGGMNSACEINTSDKGWYLATYNFNGDDQWWICRYDKDGEHVDVHDDFNTPSNDEAFNYITKQDDVKRL